MLVQFEPWRSQVADLPQAHWDPLVWDGVAQYYPWRLFAAESLRSGIIPLWNPYQFCGTPFLANGQSAVLYPFSFIFWLLPVARAFGCSAWLHHVLTGWFAYLFARRIRVGRFGALAGAVVWQTNGFFIAWIHLPTVLCTATWLPLILLFCERALTTGRARYSLAAGVALALSYLGGHPQIFLFVALLSAAYLIARGLSRGTSVGRRRSESTLSPSKGLRALRLLTTGAVTGAFALGLASAQLLPTLDLLRIAHRGFTPGPESYRVFLSHSMPPLQLGGLLLPHAFGHPALGSYAGRDNYAEYACYLGAIPVPLALWAAFSCRKWHARFLGLTALIVFLVVLGTPLNQPLYRFLPGYARAGGPGRMLLLAVFSLSLLAGLGIDQLPRRLDQRSQSFYAGTLVAIFLVIAATYAWLILVVPSLAGLQPGLLGLSQTEAHRVIIICWIAFALITAAWARPRLHLARALLVALLAADLILASRGHLHISRTGWVYPPIPLSESGQGRVLGNAADWPIDRFPDAVFPPNAATVYHLRDAFGYDSLYLARYRDFAAALQHGDPSPPLNGNLLLARLGQVYGLDMMSLAGVETVLSPVPVRGLAPERVGAFYTYRNPYARPRAWVTHSAIFLPTHQEAVAALFKLGPREDCLLITGPDLPAEELPSDMLLRQRATEATLSPKAIVRDLSPNTVAVDLPEGGGGYLFLADSFAPGWHAYGNGRELPMRIADVTFRAVAPPRESKSVLFRYEPGSFRVGLFVTLAMLGAACAALGFMSVGRGPHR